MILVLTTNSIDKNKLSIKQLISLLNKSYIKNYTLLNIFPENIDLNSFFIKSLGPKHFRQKYKLKDDSIITNLSARIKKLQPEFIILTGSIPLWIYYYLTDSILDRGKLHFSKFFNCYVLFSYTSISTLKNKDKEKQAILDYSQITKKQISSIE